MIELTIPTNSKEAMQKAKGRRNAKPNSIWRR